MEEDLSENDGPATIKGAFFLASDDKDHIDFTIVDPRGIILLHLRNRREGFFNFNATL